MWSLTLVLMVLGGEALRVSSPRIVSPSQKTRDVRLRSTPEGEQIEAPLVEAQPVAAPMPQVVATTVPPLSDAWYTKALPWAPRPRMLDGQLAGDAGFDPAGLAQSKVELYSYRDAEVKHARLAMLAAAGWPLAELWDTKLAETVGLPSIIEANSGRDPSVLNGGLGLISPAYWVAVLAFTAAVEFRAEVLKNAAKERDATWMLSGAWTPGALDFDPLNLYNAFGATARGRRLMENAEIGNGRLAMLAVVIFVLEEFLTGKPVVELTPIFFTPFWQVVADLMFAAPPLYSQ